MVNVTPVTPEKLLATLYSLYQLRLPVFVHGIPGIGKSECFQELAQMYNMDLIDLRLTTIEAPDLRGLFVPDRETGRSVTFKPEFFPTEDRPGIVLLDELTAAEPRMQASAYELVLDRRVGRNVLPSQYWVAAAGNDVEDGAVAFEMGTALADRFCHLKLVASPEQWIKWAQKNDVHPSIITMIKVKGELLTSTIGAEATGDSKLVAPSPRSWVRVSNAVKTVTSPDILSTIVEGLVGAEAAAIYFKMKEELHGLLPMEQLLGMKPKAAAKAVPKTIAAHYGLTYSMPAYMQTVSDLEKGMQLLAAVGDIKDTLPRKEIQTLGMELLLDRAMQLNLTEKLLETPSWANYQDEAMSLV